MGARRLDLRGVRREVLDLAEGDQLVAYYLHLGTELGEEGLHVALHGLAEQVVLVQQVNLADLFRQRPHHGLCFHGHVGVHAEVPEVALLVGEFGGHRAAVDVDDAVTRVTLVVLVHGVNQRGRNVRARALHDDRHILVRRTLQGYEGLRGLRLVIEGNDLELLAERAPAAVDPVEDVFELL